MRAQTLGRPAPIEEAPLRFGEHSIREPGDGELGLEVLACGICHTDLHLIEGELPPHRMPIVPGHQIVGRVTALGPGAAGAKIGERRGVGWLHGACGSCAFCVRGEENLCERGRFTGYDVDGGYAEHVVAPAAFTFPIPERFGDEEAAPLLCAGIIGYRSFRLTHAQRGDRIGMFGFGASAHLTLQVARHAGSEVAVITRSPEHQEVAKQLGASWVGDPGRAPPWPLDRAIVFAPSGRVVREALEAVRPGGEIVINAIHLDALPEMPYGLLYGERSLKSATNYTRRDAREFLDLASAIPIRVEFDTFPLEAANEVLLRLKRRELRAAGVLRPPKR